MSVGNVGGINNIIEGMIGLNVSGMGGFAGANARQNQGVAISPEMIARVLARADLPTSINAKVSLPVLNSSSVNSVTTSATAQLVAVIVDNAGASASYVQVFNTASGSVTIGTTAELLDLYVPSKTMQVFLLPSTLAMSTSIAWDATTGPHGATRSTTTTVNVAFVYVA